MTWTANDTAQILLLGMAIIGTWCAVRAGAISRRRKKENDPCN